MNISKKMVFCNFWNESSVQVTSVVHGVAYNLRSSGFKNISSLHLEYFWQPGKNQKKKVVFPERREGGTVVLTEHSEVKTVPPEQREGKTFF